MVVLDCRLRFIKEFGVDNGGRPGKERLLAMSAASLLALTTDWCSLVGDVFELMACSTALS